MPLYAAPDVESPAADAPAVALAEVPTEPTASSDDLEADSVAATTLDVESDHGYVSLISVGADTATVPPNVVDEYQDVAANHVDMVVADDPNQVSAAEVGDAGVADVATSAPQQVNSNGHASPGIVSHTPKPMPCNISLKHQRNITAQRMAAETAALAVKCGLTSEMAASLGTMAADCVAKNYGTKQHATRNKSYADSIKQANGIAVKAPASIAAVGNVPPQTSPTNTNAGHRNRSNKKHKFNTTCTTGTGAIAPSGSSLAYVKPDIPKNDVLVVAGINKTVNNEKLQKHIDEQAGRHIKLINVVGLSRTINRSRTVALELDKADYVQLSKSDFWEPSIRTWPFKGRHFWYLPKRHTKQEARNSVRDSWT